MIDATFKHKVKGTNEYDAVIQARTAELHFDLDAKARPCFSRSTPKSSTSPAMPMSF